jgi:hypothetical protein
VHILINMDLCYYAEVDGIIYCCASNEKLDPSTVSFYQKPTEWKDQYPFWAWAILEE